MNTPGYESLSKVLQRAFNQAAVGKGKERHAQGAPFHEQPMQKIGQLYGVGFMLGQAAKKMQESQRLNHDAKINELLGAINYIAGSIIFLEAEREQQADKLTEIMELKSLLDGPIVSDTDGFPIPRDKASSYRARNGKVICFVAKGSRHRDVNSFNPQDINGNNIAGWYTEDGTYMWSDKLADDETMCLEHRIA